MVVVVVVFVVVGVDEQGGREIEGEMEVLGAGEGLGWVARDKIEMQFGGTIG